MIVTLNLRVTRGQLSKVSISASISCTIVCEEFIEIYLRGEECLCIRSSTINFRRVSTLDMIVCIYELLYAIFITIGLVCI